METLKQISWQQTKKNEWSKIPKLPNRMRSDAFILVGTGKEREKEPVFSARNCILLFL